MELMNAVHHWGMVLVAAAGVAHRLGTAKAGVGSAEAGCLRLVSPRLRSCYTRVPGAHLATPLRSAAGF